MLKKVAASVAVAGFLVLGLAACGPESGTVVEKDYDEAYSTVILVPTGQPGITVPHTQYYPESWNLYLRNGEDEGWTSVSEDVYDSCDSGDFFNGTVCVEPR